MATGFFYISDYLKDFKVENFDPATITRNNAIGRPMYLPVQIDGIWLPEEPVMGITMEKIVSRTQLAGYTGRGTVKQLIAEDDYKIRISGILINHTSREYPENQLRQLRSIVKKGANLSIKSKLTDIFEVDRIVILSANFPAPKGKGHQIYEIEAISDDDFVLDFNYV